MKKVLKVFTKQGCRPCISLKMKLDTIVAENLFNYDIEYIDSEAYEDLAEEYEVSYVPMLILENSEGKIIWRKYGNPTYHELRDNLEK